MCASPSPSVSFVVPCYEEEAALAVFAQHIAAIPAQEIVFVDDGSTDGTAEALAAIAAEHPHVRVETHAQNRGVGAAMRTGARASTGAVVVIYDADRTYPLEDASRLVAALEDGDGRDVVTATPFGADGGLEDVPFFRMLLSKGAAWSYRLVLGRRAQGINVYTCAFRAWRGELVRGLDWRSDGFPAAAEMFGLAILEGARVSQEPSTLRNRTEGESKMRVGKAMRGHVGVLWRLFLARLRGGAAV